MYTLRIILDDDRKPVTNHYLGRVYHLSSKHTPIHEDAPITETAFDDAYRAYHRLGDDAIFDRNDKNYQNTYYFVVGEGGETIIPIGANDKAYIMTESGKTFEKIN